MDPVFSAGGLASGLDTNSIIETLVKLESRPISQLRTRQRALQSQVSVLGTLASKLSALRTAAESLSSQGAAKVSVASTNSGFSATPGTGALVGRFSVQVTDLAQAAKVQSQAFAAGQTVRGSTLHLDVQGVGYDVAIADGAELNDVAYSINQTAGGAVSAVVLNDGTNRYLSITNRDTGHAIGADPALALVITENPLVPPGVMGQPLAGALTTTAANAHVVVDGIDFERQSNQPTDVIPGVSLSLSATMAAPEDLVLANDTAATEKALQTFVSAYNDVIKTVQGQLNVQEGTDRTTTLAGDSTVRTLQAGMQRLISTKVPGLATVRSLADLGVKTARDGTLSIDTARLGKALETDRAAVDTVFKAASGVGATTTSFVKGFTDPVNGLLTVRSKGLNKNISRMNDDAEAMQRRIDAFRQNLIRQYTAMESVVGGLKTIGNFLNQQDTHRIKTG